jgi:hypothetical protein
MLMAILLDARPYTVVGVLPAWFNYPDLPTQLWAPIYHEKSPEEMRRVDNHNYFVVARVSTRDGDHFNCAHKYSLSLIPV